VSYAKVRVCLHERAYLQEILDLVRQASVDEFEQFYRVVNRDIKRDLANVPSFKSKYKCTRLDNFMISCGEDVSNEKEEYNGGKQHRPRRDPLA
jgi:hypothetical protein